MAKTLQGIVSSDKRDKTITVSITSRETHPLYRKQYSHTRKYTAHDEENQAQKGDKVEIVACRPFSKTKTYKLVKIIEKSHGAINLKEDLHEVAVEKEIPKEQLDRKVAKLEQAKEVAEPSQDDSKEGEDA